MTQLSIKVDDDLAAKFKEIAAKKFNGDDTLAFETALKCLLSNEDQQLLRLDEMVEKIQNEIVTAGGVSDNEIDSYIAAYRRQKSV